jgi:hypothetical protein
MLRSTSLEALREYRRAMVIPFLPGETTSLSQLACGEAEWKNIKHPRIFPACEDHSHCACTLRAYLAVVRGPDRQSLGCHAPLQAGHPVITVRRVEALPQTGRSVITGSSACADDDDRENSKT